MLLLLLGLSSKKVDDAVNSFSILQKTRKIHWVVVNK